MPHRVIYVPGVPGSNLHLGKPGGPLGKRIFPPGLIKAFKMSDEYMARLKGPENLLKPDGVVAGDPIPNTKFLGFELAKHATGLYKILKRCGIGAQALAKVGWDWRRPATDPEAQRRLGAAIDKSVDGVVIIAHSTGGLLVRHFLENNPGPAKKVSRLVAFGVPWAGSLKSLAALVAQQSFGPIGADDTQEIFAHAWSAFDLLPRKNSAALVRDAAGSSINPLKDHGWVPAEYTGPIKTRAEHSWKTLGPHHRTWTLDKIPVTNIVGWGEPSHVVAHVAANGRVRFNTGLGKEERREGDGTVPWLSASWLQGNVTTLQVPIGGYPRSGLARHTTLWRNPGGTEALFDVFGRKPLTEWAYASVDWSDKVDTGAKTVRVRFAVQRADGRPIAGATARFPDVSTTQKAAVDSTGRGLIRVRRTSIPTTQDLRFRRLVVELEWPGAAKPKRQALLVAHDGTQGT